MQSPRQFVSPPHRVSMAQITQESIYPLPSYIHAKLSVTGDFLTHFSIRPNKQIYRTLMLLEFWILKAHHLWRWKLNQFHKQRLERRLWKYFSYFPLFGEEIKIFLQTAFLIMYIRSSWVHGRWKAKYDDHGMYGW